MTHPTDPAPTPQTPAELRTVTIQIPAAIVRKTLEHREDTIEGAVTEAFKLFTAMGPESLAQLKQVATTANISVGRALRLAIGNLEKDALKITPTMPTKGRPKINEARDLAIYMAITAEGATYATVARRYNVSVVRVGQIVAQQRAERGVRAGEDRQIPIQRTQPQAQAQPPSQPTPAATDTPAPTKPKQEVRPERMTLEQYNAQKEAELLSLKLANPDAPEPPKKLAVAMPIRESSPASIQSPVYADDSDDFFGAAKGA